MTLLKRARKTQWDLEAARGEGKGKRKCRMVTDTAMVTTVNVRESKKATAIHEKRSLSVGSAVSVVIFLHTIK